MSLAINDVSRVVFPATIVSMRLAVALLKRPPPADGAALPLTVHSVKFIVP